MNRRQALGALAAVFGSGVVMPLMSAPAMASASEHLAAAKAWSALSGAAAGADIHAWQAAFTLMKEEG